MSNSQKKESAKIKLKTDWNYYYSDIQKRTWIGCLIVIGLFVLFHRPINNLLNALFIQPIFKECPKDFSADLVVIVLFVWACVFCHQQWRKHLMIAPGAAVVMIATLVIYLIFFRYNNFYDFYRVSFWHDLAYWDIVLLSLLVLTTSYRSYIEPLKQESTTRLTLIEDSPLPKIEDDIYEREAYAKHIANHILATIPQNAFAIGVIGDWGSGKTQFLLRLKDILSSDPHTIVVDFNPWRAGKSEAIIEEFFRTLSNKLKPYSRSVEQKIRDYSKKILQVGKEIQYRIIDTLLAEWLGDTSVQIQYEQINTAIKTIGKRIVILIDDVDRLTGKEVMEVLRLIRNTANFSNTFFVAGIDQQYIINVLRNTKDFANEEEYLEKVFQLTVTLPAFKKEVLVAALHNFLVSSDIRTEQKIKIDEAIKKITKDFDDTSVPFYPAADHENILEKLVSNIRDLKRFVNSFKIAINILEDEADIHDLMVLELIRNKSLELYNRLRDRSILAFNTNNSSEFIVDEKEWKNFHNDHGKSFKKSELDGLKRAIDYLVMGVGYKNSRRFQIAYNFYLYFSYQLFDLISLKNFNTTLTKGANEIIGQYNQWIGENKQRELIAISTRLTDFRNPNELLKMLEVYSNADGNNNEWFILIYRLVFEYRRINERKYFNGDTALHGAFLKQFLANNNIKLFDRARIANYFLQAYADKEQSPESLVLQRSEWSELLLSLFSDYLESLEGMDNYTLAFLGLNLKERNSNQTPVINEKAALLFQKNLIGRPQLFSGYVKVALRNKMNVVLNNENALSVYMFEGYLDQIFPNLEEFKKHLSETDVEDEDYRIAKSIILKYIDNYIENGKQAFEIRNVEDRRNVNRLLILYQNYVEVDEAPNDDNKQVANLG